MATVHGDLKFSICVASYKMGKTIASTLESLLCQTYTNFEIIVSDDCSMDETEQVVMTFTDPRIKFFRNECNVGCAKNFELCKQRASGDIIFLLAGKSIIAKDALEKTYYAFKLDSDIGAVTRSYYWFGRDILTVVRAKAQLNPFKDTVVKIHDDIQKIIAVFRTLDNPSGLAYRKAYMDIPFHADPFVEVVYPFASIFKQHKIVFLKDYTMACPAFFPSGSQNPKVYIKSPMQSWIDLFNNIFAEDDFKKLRRICIRDFVATNYIGLVQVRNYALKYSYLIREICLLIKHRWQNLFNIQFWFFSLGTLLIPRKILIMLVRIYKDKVNTKIIKGKDRGRNIKLNL